MIEVYAASLAGAAMAKAPERKDRDEQAKRGIAALGLLVVALAVLVWWAATSGKDTAGTADGGAEPDEDVAAPAASAKPATRATGALDRSAEAAGDLTILTDKSDEAIASIVTPEAIAKALDVPYCGGACDAVKKLLRDKGHVEFETSKTEELILPPKESIDTVGSGLTPAERESVYKRRSAVVLRVHGEMTRDQIPARTLFALGALLADQLDGLVYDETTRRIENAAQAKQRTIRTPLGGPAFVPRAIVIQFYRQPDGTARLLTLGMGRFGAPDFVISGATMAAGAMLVDVIDAVAAAVALGKDTLPIVVSPKDIHRSTGEPITLEAIDAERTQGDADNEIVELVPAGVDGGSLRDAWDAAVEKLLGEPARSVETKFGKDLEAAAARARAELPAVLKRFDAGEGELFVWGPFPIPDDERADGGPEEEWLWVKVASCDERACTGTLSNRPMYASNIASGKTTSMARAKIADWMLHLADGGVAGGKTTGLVDKVEKTQQPSPGATQR